MKRTVDVFLASVGLLASSPLLGLIAIAIKLQDRGPALYRGRRVGRARTVFHMLKFRTMLLDAEHCGASSTAVDDSRVTRLGRFLRRFKLDELPQLWNVLRGEMSLVGPRPQVEWAVDLYSEEEQELLTIRPGITDYASIVFRDEAEILRGSSDPDSDYLERIAPRKLRLGLMYVRDHSPWVDLKIVAATAGLLLGIPPDWCLPAGEIAKECEESEGKTNWNPEMSGEA